MIGHGIPVAVGLLLRRGPNAGFQAGMRIAASMRRFVRPVRTAGGPPRFGHGIISPPAPGMAAQKPPDGQPTAPDRSVLR
ncbi:hypothetical protein [Azospirillum argentinense]